MNTRTVAASVLIALVAVAAAAGWWQVAEVRDELHQSRAEASGEHENAAHLTDELERTRDDLLATEERLERAQGRLQRAELEARQHEDCIALVADQDRVGSKDVRFGFIEPSEGRQLVFDEAEWLVGSEAKRAAREQGAEVLDYFIRNPTRDEVPLPVRWGAVVLTTTMGPGDIPAPKCVTWGRFVTAALHSSDPSRSRIADSPYWLTIEDGYVVRLLEQYLP